MKKARIVWIMAVFMLLGFLEPNASTAQQTSSLKWSLTDYAFNPARTRLKVGVPIKLSVTNDGDEEHEFYVYTTPKTPPENWETYAIANTFFKNTGEIKVFVNGVKIVGHDLFEFVLQPQQVLRLEFTPMNKGLYRIGCHLEGHYEAGMKGVLIVE